MAIAWRARPGRSAPAVVRQSVFEVVRSMGFGDVASRSSPRMVEGGSWVLRGHSRAVFCRAAPALHRFFHPLGALCRLGDGSHDSVLHSSTLSSFRLVGIGPGCRTSLAFESPPATWLTPSDTERSALLPAPERCAAVVPGSHVESSSVEASAAQHRGRNRCTTARGSDGADGPCARRRWGGADVTSCL